MGYDTLFYNNHLKIDFYYGLLIIIFIKIVFELIENSEFIIRRYRTHYNKYYGDSLINIIGDITFGIIGYCFVHNFRQIAVLYLIITQIVLSKYDADIFTMTLGIIF